ncbi:14581_t:CDS:2, partial [Dentiscutata heterogama]
SLTITSLPTPPLRGNFIKVSEYFSQQSHRININHVLYVRGFIHIHVALHVNIGEVFSWKKCTFYVDKDNNLKSALIEHSKSCKDLTPINLNEHHCICCREIHDIQQACYGEKLECWSSDNTLINSTIWKEN